MFKVIGTNTYLREIDKLPKDYKETANKLPKKLSIKLSILKRKKN